MYAHPPLDDLSLRYYNDWLALVITHELTHVFHLDRTRGWWRVAQHVFGRSPALFPNQYRPAWVTEGLAVYFESDLTGFGRVEGTYEQMIIASAARSRGVLGIDKWSLATTRYPYGDIAYGSGALFMDYLARTRGDCVDWTFRGACERRHNSVPAESHGEAELRHLVQQCVAKVE